jgi:anti-sigma factor RsiW
MNSSDPPLSEQEEMLTAYLDGRLDLAAAAAFENANPEAVAERTQLEQLRAMLTAERPVLRNAEFFNRQVLREITPAPVREATPAPRGFAFGLWKMITAGACCVLGTLAIYKSFVPERVVPPSYYAEIVNFKTGNDSLKAHLVQEQGLTVVMIEGLEPLDEDFILN